MYLHYTIPRPALSRAGLKSNRIAGGSYELLTELPREEQPFVADTGEHHGGRAAL